MDQIYHITPLTNWATSALFTSNVYTLTNKGPLNGTYKVSSSSTYSLSSQYMPYNVFNNISDQDICWLSASGVYNSSGLYIGSQQMTNVLNTTANIQAGQSVYLTLSGEWVQIQLPYNVILDRYNFLPRYNNPSGSAPKSWAMLGSFDGISWKSIDYVNNFSWTTYTSQYSFGYIYTYQYNYFRFIVLNTTGSNTYCGINFLNIVGTVDSLVTTRHLLQYYPLTTTVTSQINSVSAQLKNYTLSSSIINGGSSNVVLSGTLTTPSLVTSLASYRYEYGYS